jgi:shikimate dehydrogenase
MDVYGLIGNPVEHSLSPPMHEAAYERLGLDARYVTFEPPQDQAVSAVESADILGVRGLNVTIPFKQAVSPALELTPLASRIGAVNTIDFSTTPPTGHNTDATGLVRAFRHHNVSLEGQAVVVGAGGAGRGAAFALADEGMAVTIANRTVERAETLAAEIADNYGDNTARSVGLDTLPDVLGDADVLVNATSVGMDEAVSPVPAGTLHDELAVLDAVYSPLETTLLSDAAAAGATTIDGAWMLLYQGVEAFEYWTGRDGPVDAMNDAVRARL